VTKTADLRLQEVQSELDALTAACGSECVPGISMCVLDGERVHELVSGVANRRSGVPVQPTTLFRIASITKLYTATLVMQLVDQRKLDLDRPVVEQLPEFRLARPEDTAAVTPRHLLTHTSGISGDLEFPPERGDDAVQKWVAHLADVQPLFDPGLTHSYSNAGYNVLGRLVEYALGTTWDAALQEKIVAPLGLKETVTLPEDVLPKLYALGNRTDVEKDTLEPMDTWDADRGSGPCGEISASARDLIAFAHMHLDQVAAPADSEGGSEEPRLLSAATAASMLVPQVKLPRYGIADHWGLGFELYQSGDRWIVGHGGNVDAQTSSLYMIPDRHAAIAVLTNSDRGSLRVELLLERLLDEWFGVRLPKHLEAPAVRPEVPIDRYLGTYDRGDMIFEVAWKDDDLTLTLTDRLDRKELGEPQTFPLLPCPEEGVFLLAVPGAPRGLSVVFQRWGDGRLYMHAGGRSTPKASS
jgi:CubicO group peptidase (beta-lactamase class C family)